MTATNPFRLEPLDATFGAVVTGLSLAKLDEATFRALYQAWLDHALLIFPGQHLTTDQQTAFARRFGELELELVAISNVREDGTLRPAEGDGRVELLKGNMGWHCDSTYIAVQAKGAVFTAHVVPSEGGETAWADMRAAYDALSPEMQARIASLDAYHSIRRSQAKLGYAYNPNLNRPGYETKAGVADPLRPLVKTHPETGRKALMIGRHAYGVPGLDTEESERLLQELTEFACRRPRTWEHRWTPGDAVIWDNRALMHRGRPWDLREPRVMYHSRIAGDVVSEGVG